MNKKLKIDETKCISCNQCIKECPTSCIKIVEKYPIMKKEENCMECQHCLAICPTAALSIADVNPLDCIELDSESTTLDTIIKSRRSNRDFRQENVSKDVIKKLIEISAYAPTGKNDRSVQYTIVDDIEKMHKLRDITYNTLFNLSENDIDPKYRGVLSFAKLWETRGIDIIFRNAPHMIIASTPDSAPCKDVDATIGLSYLDIYASSLGLSTVWCGFATYPIFNIAPELKKDFKIPEDHNHGYVIVFGNPKTKYKRTVLRKPQNIVTL